MFLRLLLCDTEQQFYVDIWANPAPEAVQLYYCVFPSCLQYQQQFSQKLYLHMEVHYKVSKYIKKLIIQESLKWAGKIQMSLQKFVNGNLKYMFFCAFPLWCEQCTQAKAWNQRVFQWVHFCNVYSVRCWASTHVEINFQSTLGVYFFLSLTCMLWFPVEPQLPSKFRYNSTIFWLTSCQEYFWVFLSLVHCISEDSTFAKRWLLPCFMQCSNDAVKWLTALDTEQYNHLCRAENSLTLAAWYWNVCTFPMKMPRELNENRKCSADIFDAGSVLYE